jgi:hypothetical protein
MTDLYSLLWFAVPSGPQFLPFRCSGECFYNYIVPNVVDFLWLVDHVFVTTVAVLLIRNLPRLPHQRPQLRSNLYAAALVLPNMAVFALRLLGFVTWRSKSWLLRFVVSIFWVAQYCFTALQTPGFVLILSWCIVGGPLLVLSICNTFWETLKSVVRVLCVYVLRTCCWPLWRGRGQPQAFVIWPSSRYKLYALAWGIFFIYLFIAFLCVISTFVSSGVNVIDSRLALLLCSPLIVIFYVAIPFIAFSESPFYRSNRLFGVGPPIVADLCAAWWLMHMLLKDGVTSSYSTSAACLLCFSVIVMWCWLMVSIFTNTYHFGIAVRAWNDVLICLSSRSNAPLSILPL